MASAGQTRQSSAEPIVVSASPTRAQPAYSAVPHYSAYVSEEKPQVSVHEEIQPQPFDSGTVEQRNSASEQTADLRQSSEPVSDEQPALDSLEEGISDEK